MHACMRACMQAGGSVDGSTDRSSIGRLVGASSLIFFFTFTCVWTATRCVLVVLCTSSIWVGGWVRGCMWARDEGGEMVEMEGVVWRGRL